MTEPEPGVPGSEVVTTYVKEINKTISEGFVTVGDEVKAWVRSKLFWWALGMMLTSILLGGGAAWLVVSYASSQPFTWSAHHADGLNETCVLDRSTATDDQVLFICHLDPPPPTPPATGGVP